MAPLTTLLIIAFLVWFWQISQRCRDVAIQIARQTCQQQEVQFLDGTATLKSIRPCFTRRNGPGFKRTYTFDYSEDGVGRNSGCIIMYNSQVTSVVLDSQH
ncbi:MAG: DUF3301 domain-containing protein [Pseudomonadota bacterium]